MLGVYLSWEPGWATVREPFGCVDVVRVAAPLLPHLAYGAGFALLLGLHHLVVLARRRP